MDHFVTSWLDYAKRHKEAEISMASLASFNNIERRGQLRICYPPWGHLGYLPQVLIHGQTMRVYNISMTGLGLVPNDSEDSGSNLEIELRWPGQLSFHTRVRAVANYKLRTHLKFKDISSELKKKLSQCLLPKLAGQRFQFISLKGSSFTCEAEEVWVSFKGETLIIYQNGLIVFKMDNDEITLNQSGEIYESKDQKKKRVESRERVAELIICFSNFQNPTYGLENLRERLYDYWRRLNYA